MKKIIVVLLMIFLATIVFAAEYKVSENKETKISKLKDEGYELTVPKGLFDEVLSVERVPARDGDAEMAINLQVKGKEGTFVHFPSPIEVKVKVLDISEPERYMFVYRDLGDKLHYYFPDEINIKDKLISFSVFHTGEWYCEKVDKDKVLDIIADKAAVTILVRDVLRQGVIDEAYESFDNFLKALDIVNENAKVKFMSDFYDVVKSESAKGTFDYISAGLKGKDEKTIDRDIDNSLAWQITRVLQRNTLIEGIPAVYVGKLDESAKWVASGGIEYAVDMVSKLIKKTPQYNVFKAALVNGVKKQKQALIAYVEPDEISDVYDLYTGKGPEFPGSENYIGNLDACAEYLEYDKQGVIF